MFIREESKMKHDHCQSELNTKKSDHEAAVIQQGRALLQTKALYQLLGNPRIKTKRTVLSKEIHHG